MEGLIMDKIFNDNNASGIYTIRQEDNVHKIVVLFPNDIEQYTLPYNFDEPIQAMQWMLEEKPMFAFLPYPAFHTIYEQQVISDKYKVDK